jgi:hypothetical protein
MPSFATPGVTVTCSIATILGGGATQGYMRITLCGYGPVLPHVSGICMIADAGIPKLLGPADSFSQLLWGNNAISPANTFYEIAILDLDKNVIQAGMYSFLNDAGAVDLSTATQILGPYGFSLPSLAPAACPGAVPGSSYTAPGIPLAVFYNGSLLPRSEAFPTLSYTNTANAITLNFVTESGDRIDALCLL